MSAATRLDRDGYDAQGDMNKSLAEGFATIRERESAKPESLRNYDFAKREHRQVLDAANGGGAQ